MDDSNQKRELTKENFVRTKFEVLPTAKFYHFSPLQFRDRIPGNIVIVPQRTNTFQLIAVDIKTLKRKGDIRGIDAYIDITKVLKKYHKKVLTFTASVVTW